MSVPSSQQEESRNNNHDYQYKPKENQSFRFVADGTSNYVDSLFEGSNMETMLRAAIRNSGRENEVGLLSCEGLNEQDVIDMRNGITSSRAESNLKAYRDSMQQQHQNKKKVYITNFAMSTLSDWHHYCAYWIEVDKRKMYVWDSASANGVHSVFFPLFYDSARFLFGPPTKGCPNALNLVDADDGGIVEVISSSNHMSFQNGGGFYGSYGSILHQNIYCHTWTLFFLELHLFGMPFWKIACMRGTHELLPLAVIKVYAQCLLSRIDPNYDSDNSKKYEGLKYIWDKFSKHNIPCPIFDKNKYKSPSCAINAYHIVEEAGLIRPTTMCTKMKDAEQFQPEQPRQ